MSKQIWKYELEIVESQCVHIPQGGRILSVQWQPNQLCLYAMINPGEKLKEARTILIFATGREIDSRIEESAFIGTVQTHGGKLVWHLFEEIELPQPLPQWLIDKEAR